MARNTVLLKLLVSISLLCVIRCKEKDATLPIDRFALARHNVMLTKPDTLGSLSVGNGEFAFTIDVTGPSDFMKNRKWNSVRNSVSAGVASNAMKRELYFNDVQMSLNLVLARKFLMRCSMRIRLDGKRNIKWAGLKRMP